MANVRRSGSAPNPPQPAGIPPNAASYIVLNGKHLPLEEHPTDFTVIGPSPVLAAAAATPGVETAPVNARVTRVRTPDPAARDNLMDAVRKQNVAHHVYQVQTTGEDIVIDNHIFVTLRNNDPDALESIIHVYKLEAEGRMGNAYVLRVTEATGVNPLRVANAIAQRPEVESCTPQLLVPMEWHQAPLTDRLRLFRNQWYLTAELMTHPDLKPSAGIQAPEAWQVTTGDPNIVLAVIDDGFDLDHPAFHNKRIHPAEKDFAIFPTGSAPLAQGQDYHGTCVASIATGSAAGDAMVGVAPDCTFLPIRIGFGPRAAQIDILQVFRYVSQFADVVNCSFGLPPASFDPLHPEFRRAITELTRTGGRRGKGLVMVFSAANDDAPTFLPGSQNTQGVKFVRFTAFGTAEIAEIPAGQDVFSGYPTTPGVVVVGAMTSLKRKAGYACWGAHLTVVAPSNNMHYITSFVAVGADPRRAQFVANYRGLGQVAAVNRPGHGQPFDPLLDDLATPDFHESFYTRNFGGTSGAAPVVSGVAALILSANPGLTADQLRQILMATADQDLDSTLDLANDPNLQGLSGAFVNGRSLLFGSGKVNALKAVQQARALAGPAFGIPSIPPIGAVGVQAPFAAMTPGLIGAPGAPFPLGPLRDGDLVFTRTRDPSAVQATQGGLLRVSSVAAPGPSAMMFGAGGLDMLSPGSAAAPVLGPMPVPAAPPGEHIQGVIHYRGATAWVLEALRGWSLLFIYVSDPGPVGQEDFAAAAQHCMDLGITGGQGFGFFGVRGMLSGQAVIRWLSP